MDYINEFLEEGFVKLGPILDTDECKNLIIKIHKLRNFDDIFITPSDYEGTIMKRKSNPGPGHNLAEHVNLDFIEKNPKFHDVVTKILGPDYNIILKKFVMAVPNNMLPDWVKKELNDVAIVNLAAFIKPEFQDITYFHGIDFHQDIIDHKNRAGDFITLYVYLEDVTSKMSPLFVVPRSHVFGATVFPHEMEILDKNRFRYSDGQGRSSELEFFMLTGNVGSVSFWSEYTLHGTQPTVETTVPRISLRYLIQRGKSSNELPIDKFLKKIDGPLSLKFTRTQSMEYGKNVRTGNVLKNI